MRYVFIGVALAAVLLLVVFLARNSSSDNDVEPPAELKAQFPAIVYYYDQVKKNKFHYMCDEPIEVYGSGWGAHGLCRVPQNCVFASYGISHDWSFDKDMADRRACTGVLLDPTVDYPKDIYPGLTFLKKAAPVVFDTEFEVVAPPSLLQPGKELVLKMDCEGCEYKLADFEPSFFERVSQLALEIHVSRAFMRGIEYLERLEKGLAKLRAAGFELIDVEIEPCGREHEKTGCVPEFQGVGFCKRKHHCQNFLFAKKHLLKRPDDKQPVPSLVTRYWAEGPVQWYFETFDP